jgi:hypothetical protein
MRNSNTKSDTYCDRDCHRHSDSHGCSYSYSHAYTYFDTATNAHTQNRTDAKNSPHPAAAASLSLRSARVLCVSRARLRDRALDPSWQLSR